MNRHRSLAGPPRGLALASLLVALASPRAAAASSPGSLALPHGASIELVADDLVQHGRALTVATFRSPDGVEEVLDFYRAAWPPIDDRPGHVENEAGPWRIVSRLENGTNVALQLQASAGGGSEGLLSFMDITGAGSVEPGPPVPPGGQLLSTTAGDGIAGRVRTHVVSAIGRAGEVAAFYRDELAREGWHTVSDRDGRGTAVLMLTRRGARAELVVAEMPDGTSTAVLNEIEKGE